MEKMGHNLLHEEGKMGHNILHEEGKMEHNLRKRKRGKGAKDGRWGIVFYTKGEIWGIIFYIDGA